jgi:hypothetical protein
MHAGSRVLDLKDSGRVPPEQDAACRTQMSCCHTHSTLVSIHGKRRRRGWLPSHVSNAPRAGWPDLNPSGARGQRPESDARHPGGPPPFRRAIDRPPAGVFRRSSSIWWTFLLFFVLNASQLSNRDSCASQRVGRLANQHVPTEVAPILAIWVEPRWRRKRQHIRYNVGSCLPAW